MQWMSDFVARLKQLDKLATITTNESVEALRVRNKIVTRKTKDERQVTFSLLFLARSNMVRWIIHSGSLSHSNTTMCCSISSSFIRRTRHACSNARSEWCNESIRQRSNFSHHRCVQNNSTSRFSWFHLGLKLQGASCRNNALFYSNAIIDDIPLLAVEWKMMKTSSNETKENVTLPVYGNGLRTELLCTINVKAGQPNTNEFHFYERGVAVLASALE